MVYEIILMSKTNKIKSNNKKHKVKIYYDSDNVNSDDMFDDDIDQFISSRKKNNSSNIPWVEKYRPTKLDKIVSHNEIINSIKIAVDKKSLQHLLFFGPSGTGKTTTILCIAHELYGEHINTMTLRLNASTDRGIETVRTVIKHFVSNKTNTLLPEEKRNIFKIVILDEIDSMTIEAQGMLRQTIEKHSATTRFCLICNDIDKINNALTSRCSPHRFAPLPHKDMFDALNNIAELEKVNIADESITSIIKISKGDMRQSINLLQKIGTTIKNKEIMSSDIYLITGQCSPDVVKKIFKILMELKNLKIKLDESVDNIRDIMVDNNMTIYYLLDELRLCVIHCDKLNDNQKIYLIDKFGYYEMYDAVNVEYNMILMSLISLFLLIE